MKSIFNLPMALLTWSTALLVAACAPGRDSAGTTSETENELALQLYLPSGIPAAGARVKLTEVTSFDSLFGIGARPDTIVAFSDSNGNVRIELLGKVNDYSILAQMPGLAVYSETPSVNQPNMSSQISLSLVLQPASQVLGTATPGSLVALGQTGLVAMAAADGSVRFADVPQGEFLLFTQQQGIVGLAAVVQVEGETVTFADVGSAGTLIEDFDDGDSLPSIRALGAGGAWYVYDEMTGTQWLPADVQSDITHAIGSDDAYQGNSLGLTVLLGQGPPEPYGSVACALGNEQGSGRVDLSELDSVSFMIKGKGQMRFAFATDYIHTNYPPSQAFADLGYILQVPETWTRISIPVDSLTAPEGSQPQIDGVTWSMVASQTDLIIFGTWDNPGDTVQFFIDDIRLHGVPYTQFR